MKAFYKIAKDDATKMMGVSMRTDLTPTEPAAEKTLHEELVTKTEQATQSGDRLAKWTIRKGRVVNIGEYSEGTY